ncbi:formyltransferase family protein [Vibrio sp. E150_011]
MKVTILCSDQNHPVYKYLLDWEGYNKEKYQIDLLKSTNEIDSGGDILFLVSCSEIINKKIREKFNYTLVLHASDLPNGRGWSPHIWEVLGGKSELTLSLLNAEDEVDTGDIWQKKTIPLNGLELFDEINHKLFEAELELLDWACENIFNATSKKQSEVRGSYYRKRTPADSQLDINSSIQSQFNMLRVSDPDRYPAFITVHGQKYKLVLEKLDD